MSQIIEIRITPNFLNDTDQIKVICAKELGIDVNDIVRVKVIKRSIDSRGRRPKYVLKLEVRMDEDTDEEIKAYSNYQLNEKPKEVVIIGAGPAGYFAALQCLELGMKPKIYDRGKDVRQRRRDLRAIQQFHTVSPDSNYCFGEGGAGTYSDGKLYTRANKRGSIQKVLDILVQHGAPSDILIDAHPHIGSNKLPKIISAIRQTILDHGGEVHFDQKIDDFIINDNQEIIACRASNGDEIIGDAFVLATGHSARDIYQLCSDRGVDIEFKPYAIGVRIEHPQELIDEIQYNQRRREDNLPAASYKLVCQVNGKGVFSFCMCPGGLIVPAATAPGEIVVNGMSLSKRDSPYANSGTVVTIDQNPTEGDVFGGMKYQKRLEQKLFDYGDGTQQAPAQRLTDFVNQKVSADLKETSYIPGIYPAPMHELLPPWIYKSLSQAVTVFGKKMRGYYTSEAQVIGLESRTSAPIRIKRDSETLMSTTIKHLYPCGEGAGFAGGILSAALDGQRISAQIAKNLKVKGTRES